MLPPSHTVLPSAFRISEIKVVVVVFPSEPVTAMIWQGQSSKNTCISLVSNKIAERNGSDVEEYNYVIKALADYFGIFYVDQGNVITKDNREVYMIDGDVVHPNVAGHGLIFEEIVRTLYMDIVSDPKYKPNK